MSGGADLLALHADGRRALAASAFPGRLQWVDLDGGPKSVEWPLPTNESVQGVALSADGAVLAVAQRGEVTLWDAASSKPGLKIRYAPQSAAISGVALSPDGRTLLTGGAEEARVQLWSVADGRLKAAIKSSVGYMTFACFSQDGKLAVTGHGDGTARAWDAETGQAKGAFKSGAAEVSVFAFTAAISSNGRLVATAGVDHAAGVWDLFTGRPVAELPGGHVRARAKAVAFSPDGRRLAVGFAASPFAPGQLAVMVWELPEGPTQP